MYIIVLANLFQILPIQSLYYTAKNNKNQINL